MSGRLADVIEALASIDAVDEHATAADLAAELALVARGLGWFEGRQARLAGLLAKVAPVPQEAIAAASSASRTEARRVARRAETVEQVPVFGAALAAGEVRGEHVDAVGRGLRRLEPAQRAQLLAQADALLEAARGAVPDDFDETVRTAVRRIEASAGVDRLARQRRNARARSWFDTDSGMWHLNAELDPETGLRLEGRLRRHVESLYAGPQPEDCPSHPLEKQGYLKARALTTLLDGQGQHGGVDLVIALHATLPPAAAFTDPSTDIRTTPETTATTGHGMPPTDDGVATTGDGGASAPLRAPVGTEPAPPWIDWGLPVELPYDVLVRLYPHARIWPVVICDGVILYAPGTLDLGRTTRLASQAQRRALRALHPTCMIPGCTVAFDQCDIHHRVRWEDGGTTDLSNLGPACEAEHHQRIHREHWELDLTTNRSLTVTLPDGTTMTTGPPGGRAA